MEIPVSHLASNIDKDTVIQDYFSDKQTVDEATSQATKKSSAKTTTTNKTGKKKKHVIDKVGPFAQKGREEGNLVMVGKDGYGIFAKKTVKNTNEVINNDMDKNTPVLQNAIAHPKSATANPQHFGKTTNPKDKARSARTKSNKEILKTEPFSEMTINIPNGKGLSTKNSSKFTEKNDTNRRKTSTSIEDYPNRGKRDTIMGENTQKFSIITEENSYQTDYDTDTKTYYTKELDDKIDKEISLQLSNLYDKTFSETESVRLERETEDGLFRQREREMKKLTKEVDLLKKHIERESQLRKIFEAELGKLRANIAQTKQKNSQMYDRIEEKKDFYDTNDEQKKEKWQ